MQNAQKRSVNHIPSMILGREHNAKDSGLKKKSLTCPLDPTVRLCLCPKHTRPRLPSQPRYAGRQLLLCIHSVPAITPMFTFSDLSLALLHQLVYLKIWNQFRVPSAFLSACLAKLSASVATPGVH